MKKLFFIFALMCSLNSIAEASWFSTCYKQEINPKTKYKFRSQAEYDEALTDWNTKRPETGVLPLFLARAYKIFAEEGAAAKKYGTDKTAHCYIGCRISQETDSYTADMAGWLKEFWDIRDCKITTHFDEADFEATKVGGQLGEINVDAESCKVACLEAYPAHRH